MLKRHLAPQTWERLLTHELIPAEEARKSLLTRIKEKLTKRKQTDADKKWLSLLIAILISVGLWVYVEAVENPEGEMELNNIPVNFVGRGCTAG